MNTNSNLVLAEERRKEVTAYAMFALLSMLVFIIIVNGINKLSLILYWTRDVGDYIFQTCLIVNVDFFSLYQPYYLTDIIQKMSYISIYVLEYNNNN